MIQKAPLPDESGGSPLTAEEQAILEELQRLAAAGCEEVPPESVGRIKQTLKWNMNDPADVERSLYFMGRDPFLLREVRAISADFAALERDDLEEE